MSHIERQPTIWPAPPSIARGRMPRWFQPEVDNDESLDSEDLRRMRNQRRRTVRRQGRRRKWLAWFEEHEPALHAELIELRPLNPHRFRKKLVLAAKRVGLWEPVNRCSPRDLPTPEERGRREPGTEPE